MANKITKKEYFKMVIEVLETQGRNDLIEVMQHEIDLLEKKASNAKMTKTQTANEGIKKTIIEELARIGTPVSITNLIASSPAIATATGGSNQKVSALMTQLKNEGLVVRTQDKKTALFSIAE